MAIDNDTQEAAANLKSQLESLGEAGAGAFDQIDAASKKAKASLDDLGTRTKDNKDRYDNLTSAVNNLEAAQKSLAEVQEKRSKLDDADLSYNDKKVEGIKTQIDAEEALQKSIKARLKLGEIDAAQAKQEREDSERRQENYRKEAKLAGEVGAATDTISEMFGIGTKLSDTFAGRMQNVSKKFKGFAADMKDPEFQKALVETFTKGNFKLLAMNAAATAGLQIFTLYALKVFAIAKEIDGLAASLASSTGSGRRHQSMLIDTRYELLGVGLGSKEAADAIGSLANRMSGFNRIQGSTQRDLSETVGKLTALGVAADTSTDITNMLTKSMGIAAEDVSGSLQRIAMMGESIGAGPAEIMRDFQEAMPYLVQFGSRAEEVFRGMKATSEATGISMGTLMSLSKKADTFEGAADMASQMNALMGMNLSTTELLMATSDERLEMIKREFDATGRSFSQMGRFEQQALATAAGFSSVDEAMRFFESSPAEIAANEAAMAEAAASQEVFDAAVRDAIPLMAKLVAAFHTLFKGIEPLLNVMTAMVTKISQLADKNKDWTGTTAALTASTAGLSGAVYIIFTAITGLTGPIGVIIALSTFLVGMVYKATQAFHEFGGGIEGTYAAMTRLLMPGLLLIDIYEFIGKRLGVIDEEASFVNDIVGLMTETFGLFVDIVKALNEEFPILGDAFSFFGTVFVFSLKWLNPLSLLLKAIVAAFQFWGNILSFVGDKFKSLTGAVAGFREILNKRSSDSLNESLEKMPGRFDGMKKGLTGIASLFQSIAAAISGMAASVRELFVGSFTKVIRLAAYMVGGAEAVGLVENGVSPGGGGVAAAAGNRTTAIANTTNTTNNVNGNTGDMQATINLTVDLGKNRVFHDAVMTVLHAEARN